MKGKYLFSIVFMLIMALMLASCGGADPTPAPEEESTQAEEAAPAEESTQAEEAAPEEESAEVEEEEAAAEEEPAAEETAMEAVTISFLTPPWGVPPDEEALAAFQAETGIEVSIQSVPMADLFSRVQVASATDESPADVIFLTEEAPSNIVATGNMLPLNDLIDQTPDLNVEDIQRREFFTVGGDVFGLTSYLQLVMMDYNSAKTAEAGFDAPPTTWAELKEQSIAIKEQGVDDHPIALGAIDWSWYLMSLSMGDPMFDENLNPVFADEGSKSREAMAMLLSFFAEELASPELLTAPTSPHGVWFGGTGRFPSSLARVGRGGEQS